MVAAFSVTMVVMVTVVQAEWPAEELQTRLVRQEPMVVEVQEVQAVLVLALRAEMAVRQIQVLAPRLAVVVVVVKIQMEVEVPLAPSLSPSLQEEALR
jgi:hypothetical protein